MESNLKLNCFILGDDPDHSFSVDIVQTRTVSDLKKLIKEKNKHEFDGVDAKRLKLWQVDIDPKKEKKLDLPHDAKKLQPLTRLSEVFTVQPEDRHLHIFVECTVVQPSPAANHLSITLNCLVLGDNPGHSFSVEIVQTRTHEFDGVDANRLKLWKVDIDPKKEKKLDLPHDAKELEPLTRLSEVFTVQPEEKRLHIFVQRAPSGSRSHSQLSPSALLHRTQQLRSEYSKKFPKRAPSSQGKPAEFKAIQGNSVHTIHWDRPPSAAHTIPTTLLHPIFGEFMDDCQNHTPTPDDHKLVMALSAAMSGFFKDEDERTGVIPGTSINYTAYNTDGDMQYKGFRYAIAEVENEIGSTKAEPHMQVLSYYIHSTTPFVKAKPAFRFPCIAITLFGPHIDFSAAIWSTRPNMQVISTALPLFYHNTDTNMRVMVARHIGALKKALQSLLKCYENMSSNTTSSSRFLDSEFPDPAFPYPYSFTCIETSSKCHFTYGHQLDPTKLLFSVKTTDNKPLCIKFTRQYSKEVHQLCASNGFAPALHGFELLPGGWYMIVMEMITEDYCCLGDLSAPYPHHAALAERLESLHQQGYVHGDIRDTNIMVKRTCDPGFKLIDFDWSGEIGRVRYPMNVYRGDRLWRPDGAKDGELIMAEHDIEMLHAMFPGVPLEK
ncbi:hypothetical protein EDB19DRAFT_2007418 [Suillus lakei]|nr:hypothetical protein EDB19DRAFT_2007418 [Suillus lakei]